MKIEYEIKLEDCLALNDHLMKTSPLMLKAIRKGQLWWASGPIIGGVLLSLFKGIPPENALIILIALGAAFSVPMFYLYPLYFKSRNKNHMERQYKSDAIKGVIGVHEMTISRDFLNDKTEYSDGKVQWNSVRKVDSTPDHTFIMTGDITAYVIPKKGIISGDYDQFVEKLKTLVAGVSS